MWVLRTKCGSFARRVVGALNDLNHLSSPLNSFFMTVFFFVLVVRRVIKSQMVVVCAFDPSTREAEADGSLSLRPAWFTKF